MIYKCKKTDAIYNLIGSTSGYYLLKSCQNGRVKAVSEKVLNKNYCEY